MLLLKTRWNSFESKIKTQDGVQLIRANASSTIMIPIKLVIQKCSGSVYFSAVGSAIVNLLQRKSLKPETY